MLRSRMGFGALAIVIACVSITTGLLPALKAYALLPPSSGGPTAEFVDIAHIAVVLSGTYDGDNLAPYSGMFFNGGTANLYQGSCNLHTGAGCGQAGTGIGNLTYNYTGAKLNHPGCGTSNITNITGGPGNWTGDLTVYLPPTGSSNACQVYKAPGTSLIDETLGSQVDILDENDQVGNQMAGAQSTSMYFMNSATTIYQASDDPTYGGTSGAAYVFTETGGSGEFKRDSMSGSACPDYIKLPDGSYGGQTSVSATYVIQTGSGGNCTTQGTFPVAVLAEKPSAVLASLNGGSTTAGSATNTAAPADNCPIQNWALRWLVCPVIDAIDAAVSPINSYLDNLLTIPTSTFDTTQEPGKAYFTAWGDFRDLAVSLIVIAALVMVIGESAGFDLLDAYSIRKILPRLLTGAVAMTLSWVLCTFVIQLFNNLNNWLPDIILSPFQGLYNNGAALTPTGILGTVENAGGATLFAGATITAATTAIIVLGIPAILSLLLTLFLAMIIAFVTLTIRTMIIVLWLITAPLGIACYILPTTQKGYHFWRDAGVSAFVAGLAVVTFIAAGQLVAIVTVAGKGPVPILAPVAIIVSYLSIGSAFRAAGGLIGTAAGAVHSAHGGAMGGLKKYRRSQAGGRLHKIANGEEVYKNTNPVARRLNPIVQGIGLAPKAIAQNPNIFNRANYGRNGRYRSNIEAARTHAENLEAGELGEKNATVKAVLGDDMKIWAIMETTGAGGEFARQNIDDRLTDDDAGVRQSLLNHGFTGNNDELNLTVSQIMAAKRAGGNGQALLRAAAAAQGSTGTGWGTDLRPIRRDAAGNIIEGGGAATDNGAGQMLQWVDLAYGADSNGAASAIAKQRNDLVASGRIEDGGAGFGDTMRAYGQVHRARTGLSPLDNEGNPTAAPPLTIDAAVAAASDIVHESAMDGNDANKVADGKPRSAATMARQSATKMRRLLADVDTAQAGVTAGTMTAGQLRAAQRLADQHLGSIMSLYDTIGHKSPQNQRAFADGLNGVGLMDATNFRGGMAPTRGVSILQLGDLRTNDVAGGATGAGTVGGPRANDDYRETRRDYNAGAAPPGAGPPPP